MPKESLVKHKPVLTNPVTIPAAVLHLLAREGETYGQALKDRIRLLTNDKLKAQWGSIYPALSHLEQDGLIESMGDVAGETGPTRKMFRITKKGRAKADQNREMILNLFGE